MIQTLQLIIAISLLVLIHELGHFFFARLFGIRVD
ncbi:MAG: site-2 protease family protein, partial [Bacteroidales bacterium]|nr:site-2 protease family protein [Bacteroidales bacterium]